MTGHHASMVATRRQTRPCQSFIRKAALPRDLGIGHAAGPWIDQPIEQFDAFCQLLLLVRRELRSNGTEQPVFSYRPASRERIPGGRSDEQDRLSPVGRVGAPLTSPAARRTETVAPMDRCLLYTSDAADE